MTPSYTRAAVSASTAASAPSRSQPCVVPLDQRARGCLVGAAAPGSVAVSPLAGGLPAGADTAPAARPVPAGPAAEPVPPGPSAWPSPVPARGIRAGGAPAGGMPAGLGVPGRMTVIGMVIASGAMTGGAVGAGQATTAPAITTAAAVTPYSQPGTRSSSIMASASAKATATTASRRASRGASGLGKIAADDPAGWPFSTNTAAPVPNTAATDASATHIAMPVPATRAIKIATVGTDPIDSAVEYASRSPRPVAGRSRTAQKYPGRTATAAAAKKARIMSAVTGPYPRARIVVVGAATTIEGRRGTGKLRAFGQVRCLTLRR